MEVAGLGVHKIGLAAGEGTLAQFYVAVTALRNAF